MNDAKMQHQIELELLFNKNQLLKRIREEFTECKEFDFIEYITEKGIPQSFGIELMAQMALHKRANVSTIIGCLRHLCHSAQQCADLLYKSMEADLVDWSPDLEVFIVRFTISDDVQRELDMFQFPLPMVVPPEKVRSNKENGYLTSEGSIILRKNHHMDDVCLDHINRMNQVKLRINQNVAKMVKNQWRNLDKKKVDETNQDFIARKKAFEKYDKVAKDVLNILEKEGSEMYLTHKYDKRGRVYCQGYHVTYQGNAWNKAVIEFAEGEVIV